MSELHYFPRYSQKENYVTNNSLLLLNRIYQFDRFKFQRLLSELDSDSEVGLVETGLHFGQQRKQGGRVVDGYLSQASLKIGIETKLGETFDIGQLRGHAAGLGAAEFRILVMLSKVENPGIFNSQGLKLTVSDFRSELTDQGIGLICTSFERLIDCSRAVLAEYNEEMHLLVDDFAGFCSENGLLPSDGYAMLVPPCSQSFSENVEHKLYYCPVGRIKRNPKYLGIYAWRAVRQIGIISKRVEITISDDSSIASDQPLSDDEKGRILGAHNAALKRGWSLASGSVIYLCDELFETNYEKTTSGGIQGFQYHDLRKILGESTIPDIKCIAKQLRQATWNLR